MEKETKFELREKVKPVAKGIESGKWFITNKKGEKSSGPLTVLN